MTMNNPVLGEGPLLLSEIRDGVSHYCAEASDLGWAPGYFPATYYVTNGRTGLPVDLHRIDLNARTVTYTDSKRVITLVVFND